MVGAHVNSDNPFYFAIQRVLTAGNLDGQVLATLCLLLIQENKQTHQTLHQIEQRLDSLSSVQGVQTASLNTMTQVYPAAPRPSAHTSGFRNTAQPPALPRQLY